MKSFTPMTVMAALALLFPALPAQAFPGQTEAQITATCAKHPFLPPLAEMDEPEEGDPHLYSHKKLGPSDLYFYVYLNGDKVLVEEIEVNVGEGANLVFSRQDTKVTPVILTTIWGKEVAEDFATARLMFAYKDGVLRGGVYYGKLWLYRVDNNVGARAEIKLYSRGQAPNIAQEARADWPDAALPAGTDF